MNLSLFLVVLSLVGCGSKATLTQSTPGSDLEAAGLVLVEFFEALSQNDFKKAAQYHLTPNPLQFLYEDIDPQDAEALLKRACVPNEQSWCVFYCWGIKDIVGRWQISPDEYVFDVRFEDEAGNLLTKGDNITPSPCIPPECHREEFTYQVVKIDENFYVDSIPVFIGCWP